MKSSIYLKSLIFLISFSIVVENLQAQMFGIKSQFSNGFEIGFKEGYCYNTYKPNCLVPLIPLSPQPTLNESSGSYQDGFNRGFQTGLDLKRLESANSENSPVINYQSIPKYRYKEYVATLPINAYVNVLAYKESVLHGRRKWLQERIQGVNDLNYSLLFNLDGDTYNNIANTINNLGNKLKGVSGDFADDKIFRQVLSIINLPGLESEIYAAYRNTLSKNENVLLENKFTKLLNSANNNLSINPQLSLQMVKEAEDLNIKSDYKYYVNDIKANAYENLKDFKQALYYRDKYILSKEITQKELQNAFLSKARILINLDNPKDALSILGNSVFNNINDTLLLQITYFKTEIYFGLGDYQNCLSNADKFLNRRFGDIVPKETLIVVLQDKAVSLRELKRYQEALDIINTAIKEDNSMSNPTLFGTRGKIYYQKKDYKMAMNDFIRTTLLDDKNSEGFYYLALCYKNLNQKTKACENLQKAIKNGSAEALEEYPNICK